MLAIGATMPAQADTKGAPEMQTINLGTSVATDRFLPEVSPGAPQPPAPPAATWKAPESVEIHWGFDAATSGAVSGRVEAWWAAVTKIEPLDASNGLVVIGENQWREDMAQRKKDRRRGLRLTFCGTTGPEAILSLWTSAGNCGFSPADATGGPILIPRVGLYITRPGSVSVDKFRESLAARKLRTVQEEVRAAPEESYAGAMAREFGANARKLPKFPQPPYEPQMQIDVPEKPLVEQWRLGAWHLKRWCREEADGAWQISIWRFRFRERGGGMWDMPGERKDYQTTFEKGHATCIGAESFEVIRAFDVLGGYDEVSRGGLKHWIESKVEITANNHGSGFADFDGILMGINPHGGDYDYDLKHTGGHGTIMQVAAHHYRITGDRDWFLRCVPRLKKACEWTLRQRKAWAPDMPKDAWGYGLQPPTNLGDYSGCSKFYYTDGHYYRGLVAVARVMAELKIEGAEDLLRRAEEYRQDIRAAAERSAARTPVVRVGDGTYRRFVPATAYSRSTRIGDDVNAGFLCLADSDHGVYAPDEPLVRDVVDVIEEHLKDSGGISVQVGHENHTRLHLLNDDIPSFLRSLYREYAALIRPWELEPDTAENRQGPETPVGPAAYEFFEHPRRWAVDKTFEEAVFLQRVRNMLVMEFGETLWLARATPRAWLEQGKWIAVKHAPTYYGSLAYEIVSDVDHGKITATIEAPSRTAPDSILLRLRHPQAKPMQSVTVNGKKWIGFDPSKETIELKGLTGRVTVEASY
ncbi:MAG: hypothetical protein O2901_16595 [Verrucomicrobia bacterium]|nr:hypothetical protein [Verrucomicrobiota bacterium]